VIHAHDWQAGLVPVFQKMLLSSDPVVGGVPVVFTIHNLAFQGVFPQETVGSSACRTTSCTWTRWSSGGRISYLKAGVNFSERITTVSPTYAREILQPELSFGFTACWRDGAADLRGILNGIDTERWNPAADPVRRRAVHGCRRSIGKAAAKRALLEAAGLPAGRGLAGAARSSAASRGSPIRRASTSWPQQPSAHGARRGWIMLGSGEERYEDLLWRHLARLHPRPRLGDDRLRRALAHRIEAGADLFLMPSRYEPCGLNQLYSLRYGTVPVVRATGGLADTVRDADADGRRAPDSSSSGLEPEAMLEALDRALAAFRNPNRWKRIQQAGMREDHSWDASAREYVKVYEQA
jgi:starch synthase